MTFYETAEIYTSRITLEVHKVLSFQVSGFGITSWRGKL